jgi:hypothetical protein
MKTCDWQPQTAPLEYAAISSNARYCHSYVSGPIIHHAYRQERAETQESLDESRTMEEAAALAVKIGVTIKSRNSAELCKVDMLSDS